MNDTAAIPDAAPAAAPDFNPVELCAQIQGEVRSRSRYTLLRGGNAYEIVRRLADKLTGEHFEREKAPKTFRLELSKLFLRKLEVSFVRAIEEDVKAEFGEIRRALEAANPEKPAVAGEVLGRVERDLSTLLSKMAALEPRFRGELPRRTIFNRLGEGRRIVFLVLMTLGLVGTFMRVNIRQMAWVGALLLATFIIAVAATYSIWGEEDTSTLDKEREKAVEIITHDLERVAQDFERERVSKLVAAIDEIRRLMTPAPPPRPPLPPRR